MSIVIAKPNQNGSSLILLIFIVAIVLGGLILGGYFWKGTNRPFIKPQVTSKQPSNTTGIIYKDNYISATIPARYIRNEEIKSGSGLFAEINFTTTDNDPKLTIQVTDDPYPLNEIPDYSGKKEITLDGQQASRYIAFGGQAGDVYTPTVQANYNGKRYMILIQTTNSKEDQIIQQELDQIISTFKFVE